MHHLRNGHGDRSLPPRSQGHRASEYRTAVRVPLSPQARPGRVTGPRGLSHRPSPASAERPLLMVTGRCWAGETCRPTAVLLPWKAQCLGPAQHRGVCSAGLCLPELGVGGKEAMAALPPARTPPTLTPCTSPAWVHRIRVPSQTTLPPRRGRVLLRRCQRSPRGQAGCGGSVSDTFAVSSSQRPQEGPMILLIRSLFSVGTLFSF